MRNIDIVDLVDQIQAVEHAITEAECRMGITPNDALIALQFAIVKRAGDGLDAWIEALRLVASVAHADEAELERRGL